MPRALLYTVALVSQQKLVPYDIVVVNIVFFIVKLTREYHHLSRQNVSAVD